MQFSGFLAYLPLCNQYHYLILEHFITAKNKPKPMRSPSLSPLPPYPGNHKSTFCLQESSLLWTFHRNRIIEHVVFCDLLLSLSTMFLRFLNVAACIITSFLFRCQIRSHYLEVLPLCYLPLLN